MKQVYIYFILLIFNLFSVQIFGQCISSGAKSSTVFSNNVGIGSIAWVSPSNTAVSDNIRTTAGAAIGLLSTLSANWNMESGFGFSIPAGAIICGIQVDIEKRQQGVLIGSSVTDNSVRILKNGILTGSEHASGATWPSTDTYVSYGGPADTWGTTWTDTDINAANFGIAYSANLSAGLASLFLSAEVDHVQITVFYNIAVLPIELIDFSSACNNTGNSIKWTTTNHGNTNYFTLERSGDGVIFETVGVVDAIKNTKTNQEYSFADHSPLNGLSYYRLKQTDLDKKENFSSVISSECKFDRTQFIFPNPSEGKFVIRSTGELVIYNLKGEIIYSQQITSDLTEIDLSSQPKGFYFYQLRSNNIVVSSGKLVINQ